jgi:hypothetical protein
MNKALLIGINTYPSAPLNGCVNDVTDMANFLVDKCSFQKSEISLLINERATKAGIIEKLSFLIDGIKPGDRIIFHYSGHGVQLPTFNPQGEVDGLDEVICPYDFNWTEKTSIRDKELASIFSVIPAGVLFTFVADSCHSEDVHKLMAKKDRIKKTINPPADIAWNIEVAQGKGIKSMGLQKVAKESNVLLVSGCKSNETSADAKIDNRFNGAMTYFLLKDLNNGGLLQPMIAVVDELNKLLDQNQYDQNPQLNGSEELKKRAFLQ